MKETTPAAMPPCFDRWCQKFDDLLRNKAQKREFRHYLGGLLGESERKNVSQIAKDAVEVTYHRLHHFLTEAIRIDEYAQWICSEEFKEIQLIIPREARS